MVSDTPSWSHLLHCTERSNPKNNTMSCSNVAASFWVAVLLNMGGGCVMWQQMCTLCQWLCDLMNIWIIKWLQVLLRTILPTTDVNFSVGNYVVSETVAGTAQPFYVIRLPRREIRCDCRLRKICPEQCLLIKYRFTLLLDHLNWQLLLYCLFLRATRKRRLFPLHGPYTLSSSPSLTGVFCPASGRSITARKHRP